MHGAMKWDATALPPLMGFLQEPIMIARWASNHSPGASTENNVDQLGQLML
jgi:hypothetical protein